MSETQTRTRRSRATNGKRTVNGKRAVRGKSVKKLVREIRGGEPYEYYSLGKYIVIAPGICGGRPTFKYTRIRVDFILDLIAAGRTIPDLIASYSQSHLTEEGISEAIQLARKAFVRNLPALPLAA